MARREALQFFYRYSGYSAPAGATKTEKEKQRRLNARALAEAEAEAEERGWECTWEDDPEGYERGDWPAEPEVPSEVLWVALRDTDGRVLASLGSIGMSGNLAEDRRYGRVIEAELALEALVEMKK
jgi:hypothetical protein